MSLDTLSVSSAPTAMHQLRAATRPAHAGVEAALPLLDPGLTRERYIRVVQAFHSFYAVLEPRIVDAATIHAAALGLADRAKLPLLARDLAALAVEPMRSRESVRLPDIRTPSHALGALYVIEGATLGGQIIRKHLRDRLGIEATTGAAFFTGYGEATRTMWSRFADHVDRVADLDPEADIAAAIAAAIETFHTMTQWFDTTLAVS